MMHPDSVAKRMHTAMMTVIRDSVSAGSSKMTEGVGLRSGGSSVCNDEGVMGNASTSLVTTDAVGVGVTAVLLCDTVSVGAGILLRVMWSLLECPTLRVVLAKVF